MKYVLTTGFILITSLALAPKASADTLQAGQTLLINFTTTAPVCPGGCDVLELFPNEAGSFGATNVTAKLFDGTTLLGQFSNPVCCHPSFETASSLFQEGVDVDFTSINNGTINGIMEMTIGTGFLTWPGAPTPILFLGHGTSGGGVEGGDRTPSQLCRGCAGALYKCVPAHRHCDVAGIGAEDDGSPLETLVQATADILAECCTEI